MLKNKWYLICHSKDLTNKIIVKKILNEDIIIYRTRNGIPVALEDRCCHRNVKLSLGYLSENNVVCGYHGWKFDCNGNCVLIPSQLPGTKIPPKAVIKKYPIKEFNNWVWIFVGDEEKVNNVNPPNIPEMAEWNYTYKEHIFEADLEAAAESLIDPYHIKYTHKDSIKQLLGQINEFPAEFRIETIEDGISGKYYRANTANISEKMYFGDEPELEVFYRFYYPNISRLEARFNDRILLILEHFMQVDDKKISMTQITLWKNIFGFFPAFGRWFMARKSNKIVNEDIALLKSQKEILDKVKDNLHEVSVKGDEVSLAFRKYWRKRLKEEN
ncbi:MAG: aromatic ring-hydroxylating dioxygenase subunit alpha [Ignavibacteriales bacterium]|jgi:phenylpropionate dioxygenase-like ring-hydroxylating dioxygenase large terminal subunit|nr:aromatic ring-hydroxylating dioxygenase subunit alpha [Ignavibacteriales bacterium]MBK7978455.1 aromatic ring-hydroxylating dioxygenase subunit alpha [Ignavibacteriota bacterium]